ncbi:MAG: hypothetical protein KTR35_22990 [Gammaproteobacteria bacterium]|nr:hypothetical protein [Gammaproteobacteria bacterium]
MNLKLNTASLALLLCMGSVLSWANDEPWLEQSPDLGALQQLPTGDLSHDELLELMDLGEALFTAKFTKAEGAGRPAATQAIIPTKFRHPPENAFARMSGPDAQACSACHNDPTVGGAGDFVTNVFVSEGFTNANFDTSDPQFSNERGTNHLFGAGLIELLAREMSFELAELRDKALQSAKTDDKPITVDLTTKGVSFGKLTAMPDGLVDLTKIDGVDADLVIRPFSQKGVMTSLRQFTVNALNHHHGMQAVERFGARWTGEQDFDEDGYNNEFSAADISALVAWQASLKVPVQRTPERTNWQQAAVKGQRLFAELGCAGCHRTELPLKSLAFSDPGPFDVSGTLNSSQVETAAVYNLALLEWSESLARNSKGEILVPLFGDLKRHKMTDNVVAVLGNELLSQRFVGRDIFMTAELWGIGSTAPYGHRNDITTLDSIILAHGGAGRESRDAYEASSAEQRSSLIAFLKTLVIE